MSKQEARQCDECGGEGYPECERCEGSGEDCRHCGRGECEQCGGSGYGDECSACGGTGEINPDADDAEIAS